MTTNNTKTTIKDLFRLSRIPGNRAPFVRLCLMAVVLIGGLLVTVCSLPSITDGFGAFLEAIHLGIAVTVMLAGLTWGFAKWAAFICPRAKELADRIWDGLFAWGIIGLAIKAMIWLYIVTLPAAFYGVVLLPLGLLVYGLSLLGLGVVSELLLTAIFVVAVCFMILLDVCIMTDKDWKQELRAICRKIFARKAR